MRKTWDEEIKSTSKTRDKNNYQIGFYCQRAQEKTGWQRDAELASVLISVSNN